MQASQLIMDGAQRALDNGVPVDRIINTWPLQRLLDRMA